MVASKNVKHDVKGIDFIMRLQPVTYQMDVTAIDRQLKRDQDPHGLLKDAAGGNSKTIFSGFIAQQVEQAARDANYEFSAADKPKNESDFYGVVMLEFVENSPW